MERGLEEEAGDQSVGCSAGWCSWGTPWSPCGHQGREELAGDPWSPLGELSLGGPWGRAGR